MRGHAGDYRGEEETEPSPVSGGMLPMAALRVPRLMSQLSLLATQTAGIAGETATNIV